jgi:hypothetical protein
MTPAHGLPPELKSRILAAAKAEPSPKRGSAAAHVGLVALAAVALSLLLFFSIGGVRLGTRPLVFVAGTSLGWLVLGVTSAWLAFARGRSMLGRRNAWLAWSVVATPALLFVWMLAWNALYPETMAVWPGRIGLRCLSFTLTIAAWPLVALALVRRERDPIHPGLTGAARGVALGAIGGVLIDLWCPIANPSHVALGHVAPMIVLMALGAVVGRRVNGVRRGA